MEFRAARRSERDEVLDLLAHWYDNREFFARYNLNDSAFRDELCLVAADGGRLVSTVQIFDRKVHLSGQVVPMGGIGSVYTLPDYRKRGIASALMRLAVETLEHEGFEMSLLFAERLNFYAQFGWRSITRIFTVLSGADRITASDRLQISPFDSAKDLSPVAAIYDSYSGRFDATVARDESYWRGNLEYAGNPGEYFVVCRDTGGRAVAYARTIQFYGLPMVMEYGYLPGQAHAMPAIFAHIAKARVQIPSAYRLGTDSRGDEIAPGLASAPQPAMLVTHSAHDPGLEDELRRAGISLVHHEDGNYMWKVVSPQRLGRRFDLPPAAAADEAIETVSSRTSLYWTADRF
jgi:predicted N-acetyltransferase YhbS